MCLVGRPSRAFILATRVAGNLSYDVCKREAELIIWDFSPLSGRILFFEILFSMAGFLQSDGI